MTHFPKLTYYGQAKQDEFVAMMHKYKKDGKFLEIGANDAQYNNNTYALESQLGWSGLMVEYESRHLISYYQCRKKSIPVIEDATKIDYLKLLTDNNFPQNIDYLQIDVDVDNRSTLTTLENLNKQVFDKYTFGTVTFEHDFYTGNYFDTRKVSRNIFDNHGYVRVFSDISVWYTNPSKGGQLDWCPFEDWYAHPSIIDPVLINDIISDPENVEGIQPEICVKIIGKHLHMPPTNKN